MKTIAQKTKTDHQTKSSPFFTKSGQCRQVSSTPFFTKSNLLLRKSDDLNPLDPVQLQRMNGSQAVQRLLQTNTRQHEIISYPSNQSLNGFNRQIRPSSDSNASQPNLVIQHKLTIDQSGDKFEKKAVAMADRGGRMKGPKSMQMVADVLMSPGKPMIQAQPQPQNQARQRAQQRITTPLPQNAQIQGRTAIININGVDITILPDNRSNAANMRNRARTNWNGRRSRRAGGQFDRRTQRVVRITQPLIRLTIRTTYGRSVNRASRSGYGRGTTAADIAAGDISLGFHEGNHGLDFINFIRNNRPPQFGGRVGMTAQQLRNAIRAYDRARNAYLSNMDQQSINLTDCVGTTIDQVTGSHLCPQVPVAPPNRPQQPAPQPAP